MTGTSIIPPRLIILALVLPLAALMGYLLATPEDLRSIGVVGLVAGLISIPLILKWQHAVLVFSWNASITVSLLPGSPGLWMIMAFVSLAMVVVNTGMDRAIKLTHVPALTWSVLALALVVFATAHFNGGMAIRALGGSSFGGKKYFMVLFAVVAYFALSLQRIPLEKAGSYSSMFILSRLTLIASNLAYFVPALWFLYYVLPTDYMMNQMTGGIGAFASETSAGRFSGVSFGLAACSTFMLLRFGVQGVLDLNRPWRLLLYAILVALSLVGGFRAVLISQALLFLVLFTLEGLWGTRWAVALAVLGALGFLLLVLAASHLPNSFQRSVSFLPLDIDPAVRLDAKMSSEWRIEMWKVLWEELPNYLLLGKGYVASATDYYLMIDSAQRGMTKSFELSILAGDYHNGPLSVIIPLGIWGVVAFGAFLVVAARVLRANYRHGRPELILINRFLLAVFWADLIFFLLIFGDLTVDFQRFAGYAALSVALNGGMASASAPAGVSDELPIRSERSESRARVSGFSRPARFRR
jgi:O-antigen ligase